MNGPQTLGERIKHARRAVGMSQRQLAEMVHVSDKTVSSYEVGRAMPPVETLKEISIATSRPIDYFITEDGLEEADPVERRLVVIERELARIKELLETIAINMQ